MSTTKKTDDFHLLYAGEDHKHLATISAKGTIYVSGSNYLTDPEESSHGYYAVLR